MKRNIIRILAAGLVLVVITGIAIPIVTALRHGGGDGDTPL